MVDDFHEDILGIISKKMVADRREFGVRSCKKVLIDTWGLFMFFKCDILVSLSYGNYSEDIVFTLSQISQE